MGTRNLTIVYKDGEYKVAQYGQWDGYPEGLGVTLLDFLKGVNMDTFRKAIDNMSFYTQEEIDNINKQIAKVREGLPTYEWQRDYPHLSRDCGGEILNYIVFQNVTKVQNDIEFAADSLFCEWAYVIDLDTNKFEIYKGFNKIPLTDDDRFFCFEGKMERRKDYHPVRLVKSYNIGMLPDVNTFIKDFTPSEDGDED